MTEIEALKFINERIEFIKANFNDIADYREALELSAMALNKQNPKKPTKDYVVPELDFCPICGVEVNVTDCNYCYYCGNKIDWSDKG